MASMKMSANKLISALNARGYYVTLNSKQFIGVEGQPHNYYSVAKADWEPAKGKYLSQEVYSTTSLIRIVLFLRDWWFFINGWDFPNDQEKWNKIRKEMSFPWEQLGTASIEKPERMI